MNRYIGTDQLAEELKKPVDVDNADELWEGWHACTIAVDEAIRRTPTADVRENVRGEWQKVDEQPYFRKHFHKVCCSVCRKQGYDYWNFCPNCGAQMKEGDT